MISGIRASAGAGEVGILATSGRGATPEEWAEITLRKLISISETAPEPVRQQVNAFRARIGQLLVAAMKNAIMSDRTNIIILLEESGQPELAKAIRNL